MSGGPDLRHSGRPDWHVVDALFSELLELPADEREARLAERSGDDHALRAEVQRLLSAERRSTRFFAAAASGLGHLVEDALQQQDASPDEAVPQGIRRLGPYRLVRLLGRGGMASVWLAERADGAYDKTIAIKVLRHWIDGQDAVRRFVAERQILSSLAHPNIAPLLDGGTTDDGTPWLATEYVEGEPITAYCAARRLGVEARLDLFLQVADAVHHAHQKLVVHRDLKPSNILVDGQGRVRLLDFGIAKLLDPDAAAGQSPLTRTAQRPMTPEYAAPEQLAGGPVTTSTDIYQLGVLLYELLAGRRPQRMGSATTAGADTLPPSTVVRRDSESGEALTSSATGSTVQLARRLKGDVDLIVLKALHEVPERRYLSAAGMAEDIRNHLKGRAISARPESALDATRRFFRRRPWAAAAVLLALGLVVTLQVSAVRLGQERDAAQREAARVTEVKDLLVGLFRQADPMAEDALRGRETTIWDSIHAATRRVRADLHHDPALRAEMLGTLAMLHHYAGHMEEGAELLEEVVALHRVHDGPDSMSYAVAMAELARHWMKLDRREPAMAAIEDALEIVRRQAGDAGPGRTAVLLDAGDVLRAYGSLRDTEAVFREALALASDPGASDLGSRLAAANGLAEVLGEKGEYAEAEALTLGSIAAVETELGPDHARLTVPLAILGRTQRLLGRPAEAAATLERGLRIIEREYGDRYESTYSMRNNLVLALSAAGEQARAIGEMQILLEQRRVALGDDHLSVANTMQNLAVMQVLAGRYEEALELLEQVRAIYATSLAPDHYRQAFPLLTQAFIHLRQGTPQRAEAAARVALPILAGALPESHFAVGIAGCLLGEAELALGRREAAAARLAAALPVADAGQANTLPYVAHCRAAHALALALPSDPQARSVTAH
ncbi:serine/threonine-protein kinase [Thioalkalivibrio sp. XN279]|uniref:serine/threonine-protein kinase n=1 Tax=Thioalkalivibrio sp. XN279 TaxID=2714953 RepID=UPI00140E42D9|nr:serine/threonine-protein kinase [Thioalkalivibrio sp. XN279]NHA14677.1 serine/threonine protein kinase [Thioalkalivibrio sp. XN279]